jgi:hypothetical protein
MAIVKKPPESVNRPLQLERPVSDLLDEYARFVDCTPDYVANYTLRKTLWRDPEFRKWRSEHDGKNAATRPAAAPHAGKPA